MKELQGIAADALREILEEFGELLTMTINGAEISVYCLPSGIKTVERQIEGTNSFVTVRTFPIPVQDGFPPTGIEPDPEDFITYEGFDWYITDIDLDQAESEYTITTEKRKAHRVI